MRKLTLLAALPVALLFNTKSMANSYCLTDSGKIVHTLDGNLSEWNMEKFDTDPVTKTLYSVDNDGENLYVAMKIISPAIQFKIMSQGMSMFIDKKGKKREGASIQFPLKKEVAGFSGGRGGGGGGARPQGGQIDPKEMRERMAARLLFLKAFGMENLEDDKTMVISQTGMVNIDFSWDEENNMYIEYRIPFIFIGDAASLKGKPISVGWKLHGGELPRATEADGRTGTTSSTVTSQVVAVPAGTTPSSAGASRGGGGRGGSNGRGGVNANPGTFQEPEANEHSMWTKYVVTF